MRIDIHSPISCAFWTFLCIFAMTVLPSIAAARGTLTAFSSEAQLAFYLKHRLHRPSPPPPAPPPPPSQSGATASVVVTAEKAAAPGITNNQVSGVDEGDIVKLHGNTLVVLRRGRLFTVSLADGGMRPVDSINAYPPGVDASDDWYDEMLISGDRVVVIGYSYQRGGTEINRFHIDNRGHLQFQDAYQMRSNDYYSSRNYASRLIGHELILYSPRYLPYGDADRTDALPALRRWTGTESKFQRIGTAREVYLPPDLPYDQIDTVHTVTFCDVAATILVCKATSVFGPDGRTFFVSNRAVYVWIVPSWDQSRSRARATGLLYRLPLDGRAPSAIGVRGAPEDQFSFREDDSILNVLVRSQGGGDAMWSPEFSEGTVSLLRVPIMLFGDGMSEAGRARYRNLPSPSDVHYYAFHNRFIGNYVLYGSGTSWGAPHDYSATLVTARVDGGTVTQLVLPHGVDRIEAMGRDAVVVGSDSHNVYFSSVILDATPQIGDRYVLNGAAQAETRSHGFFFNPDATGGNRDGVLGLPVSRPATAGYRQLFDTSAAIVFLRRSEGRFSPLGELAAHSEGVVDDNCVASCVDWYGNARPIFTGGRTIALMGYELVEGLLTRSTIAESGRVSFAPAAASLRN